MQHTRRLLGWVIFLGCMTALSGCVFFFVRHRPRCTISGELDTIHLSADGSQLVTRRTMPNHDKHGPREPGWTLHYGPLQVWDTRSGRVIHEWFHDATMRWTMMSPDGRHIAVVTGDGRIGGGALWLVDCRTGQEWRFDEVKDVNRLEFSPKGRWLIGNTAWGQVFLIDVIAHEVRLHVKDSWPKISGDDRLLYVRKGSEQHLTVWDLDAGKARGVLPITSAPYDVSADGRLLLERHSEPIPVPEDLRGGVGGPFNRAVGMVESKDYRVDLWDLETFKHRSHHEVKQPGHLQAGFSPDGRLLAMWLRGEKKASNLEIFDTITGQRVWTFAMKDGYSCEFSPDGSLVGLMHGKPKETLTMFDAVNGRILWERPEAHFSYFARGTGILLHKDDHPTPLLFLDAATGQPKATVPLTFMTHNYIPVMTPDGRHFTMGGWQVRNREPYFWEAWLEKGWPDIFGNELEGVIVMESATGRELLRGLKRDGHSHHLSADASTLITIEAQENSRTEFVIRAWDVQPTTAWLWALGTALGAGLVVRLVVLPVASVFRHRKASQADARQLRKPTQAEGLV